MNTVGTSRWVLLARRAITVMSLATLFFTAGKAESDSSSGPISFTALEHQASVPQASTASSLAKGLRVVGLDSHDASSAKLVRYDDKASFGASASGTAWFLRASIELKSGDSVVNGVLNVLIDSRNGDDTSGRVVAVYTDASQTWVAPVLTLPTLDEIIDTNGWSMGSEIPDSMQSSAVDAIREALKLEDLDLRNVGQVIARPRWITPQFPARLVDGEPVPVRPTQRVWIIQVCGTKIRDVYTPAGQQYYSGKVIQLVDGSLEFAWAFYVP